jgi:hypothetical protein
MASTRSFLSLDLEHIEQIKLFAKLTPAREFYPKASKYMQTVRWEDLSPLSHHECFVTEARSLLGQAESLLVFQPESSIKSKLGIQALERGSGELRDRASVLNAFYRVYPFGAEMSSSNEDANYEEARDSISESPWEFEACLVSNMVDEWTCRLDPYTKLFDQFKFWGTRIHGTKKEFHFDFKKLYLESPQDFMAQYWCTMQSFLSKSNSTSDKFGITIFLANLARSKHGNVPLVHTLLAFATVPALRAIEPPPFENFDLSLGFEPQKLKLSVILETCKVPFEQSPERKMSRLTSESDMALMDRRKFAYDTATKSQVIRCLNDLINQWPSGDVTLLQTSGTRTYLPGLASSELTSPAARIRSMFKDWYKNHEFKKYTSRIQSILDTLHRPESTIEKYVFPQMENIGERVRSYLKIDDLLQNPAPELSAPQNELGNLVVAGDHLAVDAGPSKLKLLLAKLSRSAAGHYQNSYSRDLKLSHAALIANAAADPQLAPGSLSKILKAHLEKCREDVESYYKRICSKLVLSSVQAYDSAGRASMLPRLSPSILLRLLASFSPVPLSAEWKAALTSYALAIASLQRAERLVACGKKDSDILNELTNEGHTNWDPMALPEWLLLEVENNIIIRPEQAQIAREMINPRSGSNSILQLNMGLGKSSVIVPIVAATLADRSKLARVVVLKSLSEQMFQLLVSKLGGLIGRRIFRLPISRSLKPTWSSATLIQKIYRDCMACGGILLVEPESLLSFELLGIDYLLAREVNPGMDVEGNNSQDPSMHDVGKLMVQTQQWLYQNARDILDESDEILSVRFELIYTLGVQQNIQFSPDRWSIIQYVLRVLAETAQNLNVNDPSEGPPGLEVIEVAAGAFPRIRILQELTGKILLRETAQAICRRGMSCLATWTFSEEELEVVLEYITDFQIPKARAAILETRVFQTEFTKMSLLLLRGLFASGVLEYVFAKKRWRVNYGLDLSRSMLAVPYHAKDNVS